MSTKSESCTWIYSRFVCSLNVIKQDAWPTKSIKHICCWKWALPVSSSFTFQTLSTDNLTHSNFICPLSSPHPQPPKKNLQTDLCLTFYATKIPVCTVATGFLLIASKLRKLIFSSLKSEKHGIEFDFKHTISNPTISLTEKSHRGCCAA